MDKDLKNRTLSALTDFVKARGGQAYWARYLFSFIHTKRVSDIQAISPLPKAFRQALIDDGFFISQLAVVDTFTDPDGTVKLLFTEGTGRRWEAVRLMDKARYTLCISSQVGCRMGCRFCATGRMSFAGDLTAAQIVDQVYCASANGESLHNVVFMGMGEPLDNLDAVLQAINILNDPEGLDLGQRHMTVSTCGLPSGIQQFADSDLQVRLAISLHSTDDVLRAKLMPISRRFDLQTVLDAVYHYQKKTGRRVTFEYCLLKDVNDSVDQAQALIQCIHGFRAHVNLIEFNDFPGSTFMPSEKETIETFAGTLRRAGIETVVRFRRGRSIQAACGQLGADGLCK
ncbi:23S rRNA (adenine(2503)-C(2))-methyltransferase RlmN [Planctomycetota bacterium]